MKQLLFVTICLTSFTVNAALFQGTSSGAFVNPTGPSGMVTTGVGTNVFTWGSPPTASDHSSSLGYSGTPFDVNENDALVFGSLDYSNGTIALGSEVNTIDLDVTLSFTAPSGMTENFIFNLGLINTPNTSDPNSSADIVNFDNTVPSNFFSFGGTDFTLEFLGFGILSGAGFTVENSFRVLENESATVDLVGRITSSPVPLPAAVWLFASGLAGFLGLRKKYR